MDWDFTRKGEEKRLAAWLRERPRPIGTALAARSTLRIAPNMHELWEVIRDGRAPDALLLPVYRAILTSAVAAVRTTKATREATRSAANSARFSSNFKATRIAATEENNYVAFTSSIGAARSAAKSAESAAESIYTGAHSAANSAFQASLYSDSAALSADSAALADLQDGETDNAITALFHQPLWQGGKMPEEIAQNWQSLREKLRALDQNWGFWIKWYERHLEGAPQPWPLLGQIATLPEEDWKKGPAHLNGLIADMWAKAQSDARDKARQSLTASEEELARHRIGANFPPPEEALGPEPEAIAEYQVRSELYQISQSYEILRNQAWSNDEPDREIIAAEIVNVEQSKSRLTVLAEKFTDKFVEECGTQAAQLLFKRLPYILASVGTVVLYLKGWLAFL